MNDDSLATNYGYNNRLTTPTSQQWQRGKKTTSQPCAYCAVNISTIRHRTFSVNFKVVMHLLYTDFDEEL